MIYYICSEINGLDVGVKTHALLALTIPPLHIYKKVIYNY